MADKHMGVAEVKRHFADVVGQVMHGKQRVIVERRGHPVVAIVPLGGMEAGRRPGERLASIVGFGAEEGESFRQSMGGVVLARRRRLPRRVRQAGG
jgi:prevent-host-death family protein